MIVQILRQTCGIRVTFLLLQMKKMNWTFDSDVTCLLKAAVQFLKSVWLWNIICLTTMVFTLCYNCVSETFLEYFLIMKWFPVHKTIEGKTAGLMPWLKLIKTNHPLQKKRNRFWCTSEIKNVRPENQLGSWIMCEFLEFQIQGVFWIKVKAYLKKGGDERGSFEWFEQGLRLEPWWKQKSGKVKQ